MSPPTSIMHDVSVSGGSNVRRSSSGTPARPAASSSPADGSTAKSGRHAELHHHSPAAPTAHIPGHRRLSGERQQRLAVEPELQRVLLELRHPRRECEQFHLARFRRQRDRSSAPRPTSASRKARSASARRSALTGLTGTAVFEGNSIGGGSFMDGLGIYIYGSNNLNLSIRDNASSGDQASLQRRFVDYWQ